MAEAEPTLEPAGLATSSHPAAWSAEYRELAQAMRGRWAAALDRRRAVAPAILEFHPGVSCPASCRFCPTHGDKVYPPERRRAPLEAVEIAAFVAEFAGMGGRALVLSGGLEPLTGPALETAECAAALGLGVELYTSGLSAKLDDPEQRRRLLADTNRIRFSLNGFSEASYRDVQLGGRNVRGGLARVLRRIADLLRDRERLGRTTGIGLSWVVVPGNAAELPAALCHARQSGLDFFDVLTDIEGDAAVPSDLVQRLDELRLRVGQGELAPLAVRVSGRTGVAPALALRCAAPRVKPTVDPYGFVWRCCHTANPERGPSRLRIGDLRARSLAEILRSAEAAPLHTGCRTCPDFERTFNALAEHPIRRF